MTDDQPPTASARRRLLRRVVAPIALVLALALLATQTCASEPVTVRVRMGIGAAPVEHLRVTILPVDRDEALGYFEQQGRGGPAPVWRLEISPGSYRLSFTVTLRGEPAARRFERRIEARDGAEIFVDLTRDLQPAGEASPAAPE
ncbi:MAG TPA: hypothetical protein VML75_13785 [Kofleriaceae bacterium]|nr:hypothetical protein [Kofleriaceae bacterium]